MNPLVILGAGKIGRMVTHLMASCGDYAVRVGDVAQPAVDHLTRKYPQVKGQVVDFGNAGSLDIGTMSIGDAVRLGTPRQMAAMAKAMRAAGSKPELDVFDTGNIVQAEPLLASGEVRDPPLFQFVLGAKWGAPATAEQFPGEGRLSGLALGVTMATAIFGGLTPFLAELLVQQTGWNAVPGAMIAAVALVVLPAFLTMPETRPGWRVTKTHRATNSLLSDDQADGGTR